MPKKIVWFTLFGILAVASACQTSPLGRRQLALTSDSQMESMGQQAFAELKTKETIDQDPKANAYVACVAHAITNTLEPQRQWEVVLFQSPQVNAFALPGGKIGVYSGLLAVANNQHQLAAVIGHEVGHVVAEHGKERVSESMLTQGGLAVANAVFADQRNPKRTILLAALGLGTQVGITLPHSRTQESEADLIGLELMAKAGFQPKEAIQLWHNLEAKGGGKPPQFLSDHPSDENRIAALQNKLPEAEKEYQASPHRPNCPNP